MIAYCTQNASMKTVTLRCSDEEYELLSKHCEKKERSLNDVLRELVRLSNQSRRERRGLYPNFPVKKGEKALYIYAPMRYRDAETDPPTLRGFKLVAVFDVSQTEGEDLPQCPVSTLYGDDQGLSAALIAYAQQEGWRVSVEDTGRSNGYCQPASRKIAVHERLSPVHRAKTLAHELGHALLHTAAEYKLHRADFELEAESIAFIVLAHFGLEAGDYSFGYIAHWQVEKDALATLKTSGSRLQQTARLIVAGLEAQGQPSRAAVQLAA